MNEKVDLKSKVLTFDTDISILPKLKHIFDENNISGMRSIADPEVVDVILNKNIHLGALFLNNRNDYILLAERLKHERPELPLFLRLENIEEEADIPAEKTQLFDGTFHITEKEKLSAMLKSHIFIRDYPSEMIRQIREFSVNGIKSMINGMNIYAPAPTVIRDKIIYGEIMSLIPVNTSWCKGYMMVQADIEELHQILIQTGKNPHLSEDAEVEIPPLISELTNLMWGGFKTVFIKDGFFDESGPDIQVPIIINHKQKYISFGGDIPQLCFEYHLQDKLSLNRGTKIIQKFIFNLNWNPELVDEFDFSTMIQDGSIELF
ncbi:MAG: hypothetical protein B6241_12890 [Spirochaetaceae bacterium 4572_59]|nr:MAG: hypothetical protein B6241_12890 [Spirochaetaceae bacterium 4572_59]